jgi:hypothetical protein
VDTTARCGAVAIAKVDNKGRNNRRIVLRLA